VNRKIIIGTRGSDLALWQANYTKQLLEDKGHQVEYPQREIGFLGIDQTPQGNAFIVEVGDRQRGEDDCRDGDQHSLQ